MLHCCLIRLSSVAGLLFGLIPLLSASNGHVMRRRVPPFTWRMQQPPSLQTGHCTLEAVAPFVGFNELEILVMFLADKKGMTTSDIINRLEAKFEHPEAVKRPVPVAVRMEDFPFPIKLLTQKQDDYGFSRNPLPQLFPPAVQPPPPATISVRNDLLQESSPPIAVAVAPMMTIRDALRQAVDRQQDPLTATNGYPFRVSASRSRKFRCEVINSVGNVASSNTHIWEVLVTDRNNKILWQGPCIPDAQDLVVGPGTHIRLVYSRIQ